MALFARVGGVMRMAVLSHGGGRLRQDVGVLRQLLGELHGNDGQGEISVKRWAVIGREHLVGGR